MTTRIISLVIGMLIPAIVFAQVIFPNRGGTGNSTAPGQDQLLIGNGSSYDLKRLVAGDNVTISTSSSLITITAALEGGGLASTDIDTYAELNALVSDVTLTHNGLFDTEAELEAILTNVSNLFTNNDGALSDDDLSNNTTSDLSEGSNLYFTNQRVNSLLSATTSLPALTTLDNLTTVGTISTGVWQGTAIADGYLTKTGDWTGTLDGIEGAAFALDTDVDDLSGVTNAAGARTNLGLVIGTNVQAYDADLTTYAGITPSANVQSLLGTASYAAMRTLLDLEAGTDFYSIAAADAAFEGELNDEAGLYSALSDVTQFWEAGDTINSGAVAGDIITDGTVDSSEIEDDTITHADILDSDQATTKCIYFEDPTADDDFQSIWANKTANDFLITEIWAESDQTVAFDLQIDDGTPADVNGTDITPAAGEAEDTTLSGDTTLAAGEELDLAITSVSGTPTWVSICWTGNWVD